MFSKPIAEWMRSLGYRVYGPLLHGGYDVDIYMVCKTWPVDSSIYFCLAPDNSVLVMHLTHLDGRKYFLKDRDEFNMWLDTELSRFLMKVMEGPRWDLQTGDPDMFDKIDEVLALLN